MHITVLLSATKDDGTAVNVMCTSNHVLHLIGRILIKPSTNSIAQLQMINNFKKSMVKKMFKLQVKVQVKTLTVIAA